jgi:hypothetical protein
VSRMPLLSNSEPRFDAQSRLALKTLDFGGRAVIGKSGAGFKDGRRQFSRSGNYCAAGINMLQGH